MWNSLIFLYNSAKSLVKFKGNDLYSLETYKKNYSLAFFMFSS